MRSPWVFVDRRIRLDAVRIEKVHDEPDMEVTRSRETVRGV